MTAILEGFYKQGKIELLEIPRGLPEGRVRVIVIAEEQPPPPCYLTFGKYQTGRTSTPKDFQAAEWRGGEEFDNGHDQ